MNLHGKQHFGMKGLIGALLVSTLLWGTAVAAHHHLDVDHELCSVCLLPNIATAAPAPAQIIFTAPYRIFRESLPTSHTTALIPAYQSRAPPR